MEKVEYIELDDPALDNYEPAAEEIEEFAVWLGADPKQDRELFWIAKDALKAKIPAPWKFYQRKDGQGEPFYFNPVTGESLWDHPLDQHFRDLMKEEKKKLQMNQKPQSAIKNSPPISSSQTVSKKEANALFQESDSDSIPRLSNNVVKKAIGNDKNNVDHNQNDINQSNKNDNTIDKLKETIEKEKRELEEELKNLKIRHQKDIEQENYDHNNRLKRIRSENEEDIMREKNRLADEYQSLIRQERNKFEDELDNIRRENQKMLSDEQKKQLYRQKITYDEEKRALENEYNRDIENIKKKNKKEIEELNEMKEKELAAIKKTFEDDKNRINKQNGEEIDAIKTNHSDEKKKLEKANKAEVYKLKEKFEEELEILNKQNSDMLKQVRQKQKQLMTQAQSDKELDKVKQEFEAKKKSLIESCEAEIDIISKRHASKKRQLILSHREELRDIEETHNLKLEQQKKKIEESNKENEIRDTRNALELKKKRIENQYAAEIEEMEEEHKIEIEELKRKHSKAVKQLKDQTDKVNKAIENSKKEYAQQKKLELLQITEEYEDQLEQLRENYHLQKEQEKVAMANEMKIFVSKLNTEKLKLESEMKTEIELQKQQLKRDLQNAINQGQNYLISSTSYNEQSKISTTSKKNSYCSMVSYPPIALRPTQPTICEKSNKEVFSDGMVNKDDSPKMQLKYTDLRYSYSDEDILNKINKLKGKVSKFETQYDQMSENLSFSIRDSHNQINSFCQNHRSFISDQNKQLSTLAMEFQQQVSNMSRSFNSTLSSLENSYRVAINTMSQRAVSRYQIRAPESMNLNKSTRILLTKKRRKLLDETNDTLSFEDSSLIKDSSDKYIVMLRKKHNI